MEDVTAGAGDAVVGAVEGVLVGESVPMFVGVADVGDDDIGDADEA